MIEVAPGRGVLADRTPGPSRVCVRSKGSGRPTPHRPAHLRPKLREMTVPISTGELILRSESRAVDILVTNEHLTITQARYSAGEQISGPHIHDEHTDAYVLEGELTFEIGREGKTLTVPSSGFVAVPPGSPTPSATTADAPHACSRSAHPTEASPPSCAASATAWRSNGTSLPYPPTAAYRQTQRSSRADTPAV